MSLISGFMIPVSSYRIVNSRLNPTLNVRRLTVNDVKKAVGGRSSSEAKPAFKSALGSAVQLAEARNDSREF